LLHAVETSPFYKERYFNIDVSKVNIGNLSTLPILTKDNLRNNIEKIYSKKYTKNALIKSETSGSTGDPFIFYRDKDWDAYHRAAIWRGLNQFNVQPYNKNLYLWGFIFTPFQKMKMRILDKIQNRYRFFQLDESSIKKKLDLDQFLDVVYISGYSSVIYALAKICSNISLKTPCLRLIKGTSEKIYPEYKKLVKKVFNVPFVSEYGSAETGIISFTCPYGNDHVIRENVILENVDNRAVVTNLHSYSLPIIRYDLGDYIETSHRECQCGRTSHIVDEIIGRIGVLICGVERNYPSLTLYYVFKEIAVLNGVELVYRAEQFVKGAIIIYLEGDKFESYKQLVWNVSSKYLPGINISVEVLPFDYKISKFKDFFSHLN